MNHVGFCSGLTPAEKPALTKRLEALIFGPSLSPWNQAPALAARQASADCKISQVKRESQSALTLLE